MSKYADQMYRRHEKLKRRLQDAFASARSFGSTADHLHEALARLQPDRARLSPHYRGLLQGYQDALMDELYHRDLIWTLYLDGKAVTSNMISMIADHEEWAAAKANVTGWSRSHTWDRVKGRHEWHGSGRPFTDFAPPVDADAHATQEAR